MVDIPKKNSLFYDVEENYNSRLLGHHEDDEIDFWENVSMCSPLFTPRGEHSEKPVESFEKVLRVFGDLPRLDMFARKRRFGWDSFGDQLDMFPPDEPYDKEKDVKWKHRQDENAEYAERFSSNLTEIWKNRPVMNVNVQDDDSVIKRKIFVRDPSPDDCELYDAYTSTHDGDSERNRVDDDDSNITDDRRPVPINDTLYSRHIFVSDTTDDVSELFDDFESRYTDSNRVYTSDSIRDRPTSDDDRISFNKRRKH
jgi:hypothetical protein